MFAIDLRVKYLELWALTPSETHHFCVCAFIPDDANGRNLAMWLLGVTNRIRDSETSDRRSQSREALGRLL